MIRICTELPRCVFILGFITKPRDRNQITDVRVSGLSHDTIGAGRCGRFGRRKGGGSGGQGYDWGKSVPLPAPWLVMGREVGDVRLASSFALSSSAAINGVT
jgi:hypothetical protein